MCAHTCNKHICACTHTHTHNSTHTQVTVAVALEREQDGTEQPACHAPRFPGRKDEGWWLVVGDSKANALLAIKRVNLGKAAKTKLDFTVPSSPGQHSLTLYFMCDSWLGCDQEYEIELKVSVMHERRKA